MKTLIVEDDFASRLILQKFLAPFGETHVAVNGKEALDAFKKEDAAGAPYDLLCLDIMMPEMDGQTCLKNIREYEEEKGKNSSTGAKIIMTTALGDTKNVMEAFHALCDAYLVKPINKSDLINTLLQMELV